MTLPSNQELKKIWAEVPSDYYFHLNFFQKLWHDVKWKTIKNLLLCYKSRPFRILEIGCSSGHLSSLLFQLYPKARVTGIDVYKSAIVEAQKRFWGIEFLVADAHRLPFKDNSFDVIVTSETIEHVKNPSKMLSELARVLSKKGIGLIEMDSGSLLFRIIWYFWTTYGKGKVWKNAHLYPFTAVELEEIILKSKLHIREKHFSHLGMAVTFMVSKNQ